MSENIESGIKEIIEALDELKQEFSRAEGEHKLLGQQMLTLDGKIVKNNYNKVMFTKAIELLACVQKVSREKIQEKLETIVTYALRYIYSSEYEFKLEFTKRGHIPEVNFNIISPGHKHPSNPIDSDSGGVIDIISLALRIALIQISNDELNGFLILDESFKMLSSEYLANAHNFLEAISAKLNRQIIVVTHHDSLIEKATNAIKVKS